MSTGEDTFIFIDQSGKVHCLSNIFMLFGQNNYYLQRKKTNIHKAVDKTVRKLAVLRICVSCVQCSSLFFLTFYLILAEISLNVFKTSCWQQNRITVRYFCLYTSALSVCILPYMFAEVYCSYKSRFWIKHFIGITEIQYLLHKCFKLFQYKPLSLYSYCYHIANHFQDKININLDKLSEIPSCRAWFYFFMPILGLT